MKLPLVSDGIIFDYSQYMDVSSREIALPKNSFREFKVTIDDVTDEKESPFKELTRTFKDAKERWVSTFERDYILTLLKKNKGNISHAAREADIDRKYFRKLMKKYGIEGGADLDDDAEDTVI